METMIAMAVFVLSIPKDDLNKIYRFEDKGATCWICYGELGNSWGIKGISCIPNKESK